MPIYKTQGTLTDSIPQEHVAQAQAYLTRDDMTQYLGDDRYPTLASDVEHIEWKLESDGYHWSVTAFARREMTDDELQHLSSWVSGQNSDGLGEGFEQQDFAWIAPDEYGYDDDESDGHMCSFDWQTNDCAFARVK